MNKIFSKLAVIIIPIGITITLTNFIVDPANLFSKNGDKYVTEIAEILSKKHNVDNISNYNERRLQKELLTRLNYSPDIIVLGSSRIMEINSSFFPDKSILNMGVSHANINDLIALTGLLDSLKIKPKHVIINTDPFLLCTEESTEWQELKTFHSYFLMKNDSKHVENSNQTFTIPKYFELFSFKYFNSSISFLLSGNNKKIIDKGLEYPEKNGRLFDGSIAYSYTYKNPDTTLMSIIASRSANTMISKIDSNKSYLLDCLVKYYKTRNIELEFIMLPFHIDYYKNMNKKYDNIFNYYESYFNNYAVKHGIKINGSFNSEISKTPITEFYDTYHCSQKAILDIINTASK